MYKFRLLFVGLVSFIMLNANESTQEKAPCSLLCNVQEEPRYCIINQLDEQSIEQTKKMICCNMHYNAMVRAGIKAAATFGALYALYKIFLSNQDSNPIEVNRSEQTLQERLAIVERESAATARAWNKLLADTNPNWFTWQWAKNWTSHITKGLVSMAATKGLFDIGERAFQSIFHDGNSQWFVTTRTRLIETVQELTEYGQKFDAMEDPILQEHYTQEIAFIINNLIKQCSLVIAFIEYAMDSMPHESDEILESKTLAAYLRVITNDFAQTMERDLNYRKNPLIPTINQFTAEFGRTMMSFSRIEHPIQ